MGLASINDGPETVRSNAPVRPLISVIDPITFGEALGRPAFNTKILVPTVVMATGSTKPNFLPEITRTSAPLLARNSLTEPDALATKRLGPKLVIAVG